MGKCIPNEKARRNCAQRLPGGLAPEPVSKLHHQVAVLLLQHMKDGIWHSTTILQGMLKIYCTVEGNKKVGITWQNNFLGSFVENIVANKVEKTTNFHFFIPKDHSRLKPLKKGTKSPCFKGLLCRLWEMTRNQEHVGSPVPKVPEHISLEEYGKLNYRGVH